MPFLPGLTDWISSHLEYVPAVTRNFCGDLTGLKVLNVGCGDMIADIGLLKLDPEHIEGLDVLHPEWNVVERAAATVREAGFVVPSDYSTRLSFTSYDGITFPFRDDSFEFIFSWSAFEHIADVPSVLSEMRRVVRPGGKVFIQVYPWFPALQGSHVTDFIEEPFFHVTRSAGWVRERLEDFVRRNPERAGDVLGIMWGEFQRLNGYSAGRFLKEVLEAGFAIEKYEADIRLAESALAPDGVCLADVLATGSMVLMLPGKRITAHEAELVAVKKMARSLERELGRERELRQRSEQTLQGVLNSKSWRVTRYFRDLVSHLRARA